MEQFNANKAREIVRNREINSHVDFLKMAIVKACEEGRYKVIIREEPFAQCLRNTDEITKMPLVHSAINSLRADGFKCCQYCFEGQFCDWGLEISWEERLSPVKTMWSLIANNPGLALYCWPESYKSARHDSV